MISLDPLIRLPLYMALGLISEVLFTALCDLFAPSFLSSWNAKSGTPNSKRDPKAMGYTFLWMLPIYALMIFFEPFSVILSTIPWFIRGLIYLAAFWLVEFIGGAVIKKISGRCPWDYSYSRFSYKGYIRWDFAPIWFSFALFVEWISTKFVALTPFLKEVF